MNNQAISTPLYDKALKFAKEKHDGQIRKNSGESYVNHCIRVSETVKNYSSDEKLAIVALLHDTLEDTQTTFEELKEEFGTDIAWMVQSLTNDPNAIHELGKTEYLIHKVRDLGMDELLIKLADRLDNTNDLKESSDGKGKNWAYHYASQTNIVFFQGLNVEKCNASHLSLLSRIHVNISPFL